MTTVNNQSTQTIQIYEADSNTIVTSGDLPTEVILAIAILIPVLLGRITELVRAVGSKKSSR
jgi:hypothetical protein